MKTSHYHLTRQTWEVLDLLHWQGLFDLAVRRPRFIALRKVWMNHRGRCRMRNDRDVMGSVVCLKQCAFTTSSQRANPCCSSPQMMRDAINGTHPRPRTHLNVGVVPKPLRCFVVRSFDVLKFEAGTCRTKWLFDLVLREATMPISSCQPRPKPFEERPLVNF